MFEASKKWLITFGNDKLDKQASYMSKSSPEGYNSSQVSITGDVRSPRACATVAGATVFEAAKMGIEPIKKDPIQNWKHFGSENTRRDQKKSGWWFGTFFIFPYIGNNHPN